MVRTDKRREQSKSAARSRRRVEAEVFVDLAEVLPLSQSERTVYQVDRIAVLRLAVTYYHLRKLANTLFTSNPCLPGFFHQYASVAKIEPELGAETSLDNCLDGFVLIVSQSGHMLYVSNAISQYVGFTQADLMGRPFKDYVHVDDWEEINLQLKLTSNNKPKLFFRMKTALTPRGGRSRKLTTAVCQAMRASVTRAELISNNNEECFYVYCVPVSNSNNHRSFSFVNSLMSRHEIDMKFRFSEEKLASLLQYKNSKALIGQSLYQFIHPDDLQQAVYSFKQLYSKGHCTTDYYRLMTKNGDYVWVISEASLMTQNVRGVHQKYVICNHQILSDIESENGGTISKKMCDKILTREIKRSRFMKTKMAAATTPPPPQPAQFCEIKVKQEPSDYSSCDSPMVPNFCDIPLKSRSCALSKDENDFIDLKPSINSLRFDFEGIETDLPHVIFSSKDHFNDDDLSYMAPFVADDILDLVKYDELPWSLKSCSNFGGALTTDLTDDDAPAPKMKRSTSSNSSLSQAEKFSPLVTYTDHILLPTSNQSDTLDELQIAIIKNDLVESSEKFLQISPR
jgi:PAS domain S-box-containing protein